MNGTNERREHPRARVKVRVEVRGAQGGRPSTLHTSDLSVGGARCQGVAPAGTGDLVHGRLYLPLSEGGRDVDVPVDFTARVVRVEPHAATAGRGPSLSLAFTEIGEADRAELRRFLLDWMADDSPSHAAMASVS